MKFTIATIIAFIAASAVAQDGGPPDDGPGGPPDGPGGPGGRHHHGPPPWVIEKHLTCPTAGGTATVSLPCPTGPPSHPHSRPTGEPTHRRHHWDGTVTVFPSGAPEVTKTMGIDCQGGSGPSCSQVTMASMTCSPGARDHHSWSHKSHPTVTASAGATKTVPADGPPTCKAATTSAA